MTRDEERTLLQKGALDVEGRVITSSNQALLVNVTLDGVRALACYKAEAGERRLWDFPEGLWRREVAAYELDRLLGTDLVPTTVERPDGPFGPGSLQWWVDDNLEDHYFTLRGRPDFATWLRALCAFDVVANNADRKSGHVLYDGGRLWAIDNGLCFGEADKLRTVIWDFAGEPLGDELGARVERVAGGDLASLSTWLAPPEVAATKRRARALVHAGHYPRPDEEADWPPYPWPLV